MGISAAAGRVDDALSTTFAQWQYIHIAADGILPKVAVFPLARSLHLAHVPASSRDAIKPA